MDPASPRPSLLERLSALLSREPEDREELLALLHAAFERNLLDADALAIIEGALQMSELQVGDVMIPRAQMDIIRLDDPLDSIAAHVVDTGHSRFPVGDNKDDIVGIFLAKDLLRYYAGRDFDMPSLLRPAVFVPESKRLNVLLREFRVSRNHMAIVVDEYGSVAGLVTIEDVLEQIVGDIEDEFDRLEPSDNIQLDADGRYRVRATTEIGEFNAAFGCDFSDAEVDTVGGLLICQLGRLPRRGEVVMLGKLRVTALRVDGRRVHTLLVQPVAGNGRSVTGRVRDSGAAPARGRLGGLLAALLAGGASVFAFEPFGIFPLAVLSLAVLAGLAARESRTRGGFALGFAWGLGAFLAGVSWLYVALNRYGGMPMPLAAFAILLFSAYLALFPAAVGALFVRFGRGAAWRRALLFAGLWIGAEALRGWLFTGFPWLALGYSQTPPSPLAGYLSVLGVYGVGGFVAFVAALVALTPWRSARPAAVTLGAILVLCGLGYGLGRVAWTAPTGKPLEVALIQTNIEQGLKWRPELLSDWLDGNARLVREHPADLVVLPETTLPLLADRLPDGYLEDLAAPVAARGGDLVFGVFLRDARGAIYNAALSLGASPSQTYAKQHLVPFGEYSPPFFGWFYELVDIPMSDQTRGAPDQPPLRLGDQRVAINICYEDLFGRELIRSLPEATLMLNLSNLAWYGDSFAQPQHLQIARVRAMETGRPMLRSTNTGMTALVQPDGRVADVLPPFTRGALSLSVQGYEGLTPYVRWGDSAALLLAALALLVAGRKRRKTGAGSGI